MAIIKCKMCGGSIEISADKTYGTCDSCGSTMTFPKVSDEQRVNLFNRANHFRRQNEFDKAIAAYERILEQDNTDAEAHWGVVLSRYGIEYVEDPVSHERIPTCHRVQLESILSDTDYLAAKENAPDTYSAELYEKEAKQIAEIQKGILAISAQEDPYDVFICYKESTDGGSRTKDSTLAQDIYYQLTNDGYKVFFSRITLEDKLGKQYEPYIFAALNSAKVMLVIGTKPEYLNAVWVKNEWSRYLALMKQDRSKLLIPCYRDMDPYDLPEELSALQSQDMSKIGFMQDLLHGIKKVLDTEKEEAAPAGGSAGPGVKSLLTRAQLFLEDGDFSSANEYADKVLDIDPKYAPAYIVKVQVKEKIRKEADLAYCKHTLTNNTDYQKAVRFADPQNKIVYEGYNKTILTRLQEESREKLYRDTILRYKQSEDDRELYKIAAEFDRLKDYKDSVQQAKLCREKAQRIIDARAQREAEIQAEQERIRIENKRKKEEAQQRFEQAELERKRRKEQERIEEELRKKRNKKTATIVVILLIILAIVGAAWYFVLRPSKLYDQAGYSRMEGKYDDAISALEEVTAIPAFSTFAGIGGFEDAETIIKQCEADKLFAAGDYIGAYEIYSTLDSRYQTNEDRYAAMYQSAVEQMENGEFEAAITSLNTILNYSDSASRIGEFYYADAQAKLTSGDAEAARAAFVLAGEYSDSNDMIAAIDTYNSAITFMAESKWAEARACLSGLTILDSAAKLEECYAVDYAAAEELYNNGDIAGAYTAFLTISEYADSAARAAQIESDYQVAETLLIAGSYDEACDIYASLKNYSDSIEKANLCIYTKAENLFADGSYDEAAAVYASLGGYSDSTEKANLSIYTKAEKLFAAGSYDEAAAVYESLGDYSDCADKILRCRYESAKKQFDNGQYQSALESFSALGDYSDSVSKAEASSYFVALDHLNNYDLAKARENFVNAGEYEDSAVQIQNIDNYTLAVSSIDSGDDASARQLLISLNDYLDSAALLQGCYEREYASALSLFNNGDYAGAYCIFAQISEYSDSATYTQQMESDYQAAERLCTEGAYDEAISAFSALKNYADSPEQVNITTYAKAEELFAAGSYDEAIAVYTSIAEYKDSAAMISECHYQKALVYVENGQLFEAEDEFEQITVYSDVADHLVSLRISIADAAFTNKDYALALEYYLQLDQTDELKAKEYNLAQTCYEEGYFEQAVLAYEILGQYELSISKLPVARYAYASQLFDNAEYAKAAEQFTLLNGSSDSAERAKESTYLYGKQQMEQGLWENARITFHSVKDYEDASTMIMECRYQIAEAELAAGNYAAAQTEYVSLNGYNDSANKIKLCIYNQANELVLNGDYAAAEELYVSISDYEDNAEKVKLCRYEQGNACYAAQDYAGALVFYTNLNYSNSETLAAQCHCEMGKAYLAAGNPDDAVREYAQAIILPEAQEMLYSIGKDYAAMNQNHKAIETLWAAGDYAPAKNTLEQLSGFLKTANKNVLSVIAALCADASTDTSAVSSEELEAELSLMSILPETISYCNEIRYAFGMNAMNEGNYEKSISYLVNADGYLDVATQILDASYNIGIEAMGCGDYDKALAYFTRIEGYQDAAMQILAVHYKMGLEAINNGDYGKGLLCLTNAGEYPDAKTQIYKTGIDLLEQGFLKESLQFLGKQENNVYLRDFYRGIRLNDYISSYSDHTVGLKAYGTVVAVGSSVYGQCATRSWSDIIAVAAGGEHTVGLKADGTVIAVGDDARDQCNTSRWTDIVAVAAGYYHTIGLRANGTVVATGVNDNRCDTSGWTDIVAVAAGDKHTVGLKANGTVVATGVNDNRCDTSSWTDIVAIAAGDSHTVGLKADGTVVTTGPYYSPESSTRGYDGAVLTEAAYYSRASSTSGYFSTESWTDIVSIAAGGFTTVGLKANGTIVVVGNNFNTKDWTNIVAVAVGSNHIVGLKEDGTVVAVGEYADGRCNTKNWDLWNEDEFAEIAKEFLERNPEFRQCPDDF